QSGGMPADTISRQNARTSRDCYLGGASMANHRPIIVAGGQLTGSVDEDVNQPGSYIRTGTFNFSDLDLTDIHTVTVKANGPGYLGTLAPVMSQDTTGGTQGTVDWTYQVTDEVLDRLADGETRSQSYVILITDSAGAVAKQTVTIDLTGSNDGP